MNKYDYKKLHYGLTELNDYKNPLCPSQPSQKSNLTLKKLISS